MKGNFLCTCKNWFLSHGYASSLNRMSINHRRADFEKKNQISFSPLLLFDREFITRFLQIPWNAKIPLKNLLDFPMIILIFFIDRLISITNNIISINYLLEFFLYFQKTLYNQNYLVLCSKSRNPWKIFTLIL